MCPRNINRSNWLSDSSEDTTFNISVSGLNLVATTTGPWSIDLIIVCTGLEVDTIIKTDSSVEYNDEEEGLSIENNSYESCHLDSIRECETYGGFNPNWYCDDIPFKTQYSSYDMSNFDSRTKQWHSVGLTHMAGRASGDILIQTDPKWHARELRKK